MANLRLEDLQSCEMCHLLANQNILNTCTCAGLFEHFASSQLTGCSSDLLCQLSESAVCVLRLEGEPGAVSLFP